MDEKMKERLVGAAVVVALGVVFIPMLLDGPPRAIRETRELALPGQDQVGLKQVTIDLGNPGSSVPRPDPIAPETKVPPMEAQVSAEAGQESKPQALSPKPDAGAAAAKVSAQAAQVEAGEWLVQVGSFSSRDNAERLAAQLKAQGFKASVSQFKEGGRTLHRVRVGPAQAREGAEALAQQLRDGGQKVKVVPNL
jgi:DedD protein